MKSTIMKKKSIILILAVITLLSAGLFSVDTLTVDNATPAPFVNPTLADDSHPGIGDTPPDITEPDGWRVVPDWRPSGYYGIVTETTAPYELQMEGPVYDWIVYGGEHTYIESAEDLAIEKIEAYRPVFVVESDSWYSHTLDMAYESSVEYSIEINSELSVLEGAVSISGGYTHSSTSIEGTDWDITATGGETKVVYLAMTFMHVIGSVDYAIPIFENPESPNPTRWEIETWDYDAVLLYSVEIGNKVTMEYAAGYPGFIEKPAIHYSKYDYNRDGYPSTYEEMGSFSVSYEEVESYSNSFGISLDLSYEGVTLSSSVTFTTSSSLGIQAKHSFEGTVPAEVDYFFRNVGAFFNLNIDPVYVIPTINTYLDESGTGDHTWTVTDSPYDKLVVNRLYDGRDTLFHYEDITHPTNWMLAESDLDLSDWDGSSNLEMGFCFRAQSNYAGSSVTQFRLRLYDNSANEYISFTNPTGSSYYIVAQNNRQGQTWISGKDSGWQTESFELLVSELGDYAGTNGVLSVRWGSYDSWSYDWYQRQYLDYITIVDTATSSSSNNPYPTPLPSPTDAPTFFNVETYSVGVSWSPIAEADGYRLYMDGNLYGEFTRTTTSTTITGLTAETTYSFTYAVLNGAGWSSESPIGSVTTLEYHEPTPDQPRSLMGIGDEVSHISLAWKSPSNVKATSYNIYRWDGSSYVKVATIAHSGGIEDGQVWTDSGLTVGVTYYYRVTAVNADGVEGAYASWSGQVGGGFTFTNDPSLPFGNSGLGDIGTNAVSSFLFL